MSVIDKAKNSLQRLTGRGKRTAGRVSGKPGMEARGSARKIGGDVKQAGENLKDAAR
ncbi:CsbD family protein [Pseudofrankia inefficax]|uniref:CsbD family protein n=1 Tax=Pseudofrankia inefficax (strain DSM 45817 / CECT 9037 / DDB 130130 / EuI1c) TaxID=298654 RepID=E3J790_PSEI1|nr:CsbD family protein [Pseudofrankia inefficax]ADP84454.1 CsbD family protein [Pseudofrankia inefficax]